MESQMTVVQEAVKVVVGSLRICELRGFAMMTRELVERKWVQLLVSFCYNIFEAQCVSTVQHYASVWRLCIKCRVTRKDITSSEMTGKTVVKNIKMVRDRFIKIARRKTKRTENGHKVGQEEEE